MCKLFAIKKIVKNMMKSRSVAFVFFQLLISSDVIYASDTIIINIMLDKKIRIAVSSEDRAYRSTGFITPTGRPVTKKMILTRDKEVEKRIQKKISGNALEACKKLGLDGVVGVPKYREYSEKVGDNDLEHPWTFNEPKPTLFDFFMDHKESDKTKEKIPHFIFTELRCKGKLNNEFIRWSHNIIKNDPNLSSLFEKMDGFEHLEKSCDAEKKENVSSLQTLSLVAILNNIEKFIKIAKPGTFEESKTSRH